MESSARFYYGLFGWEVRAAGNNGYAEVQLGGKPVTGFIGNEPDSGAADVWTTYLNVADVHAAAYSTRMHGGKVHLKPVEVPGQGTMTMISDPAGIGVGLFQAFEAAQTAVSGAHGTRIWSELRTKRFDAVSRFYREALGWCLNPVSDTGEFRYCTLGQGADAAAGIWDISGDPGARAGWRSYFAVDNADDTLALAESLGGSILQEAQDSFFGRVAVLADTTGAEFAVIQPAKR